MTCPDEPTLVMLADEELDAQDSASLREHVGGCASCDARLADLRAERGTLMEALGEGAFDEPVMEPAGAAMSADGPSSRRWRELASLAAAVCVAAGVGVWATGVTALWQVPPFLEWIDPFHPSGRLTWLFTGITLGLAAFEGGVLLTSMVTAICQFLTTLLPLLAVVLAVARCGRRTAVPASLAIMFATVAVPAEAFVVRTSEDDVVVPAGETIDDTLIARGQRVTVNGVVNGDIITAGQSVVIRGTVRGNLVSWSQTLDLEGEVGGSVFVVGQFVTVPGRVDGSLYVFAQEARILEESRIGGGVASYSNTLAVDGRIARDVRAAGYRVDVTGAVQRNVNVGARHITVGPRSSIGGTLNAEVRDRDGLQIDPAATLGAEPVVRLADDRASPSRYLTTSFYLEQVLWLVAAFLTGWLLLWVAPGTAAVRLETPVAALRTLGVGFLCAVATPVVAVLAGLTLVGLPVALVALALWGLGIYLAKIPVALFLGRAVLGPRGVGGPAPALLVGLLAVFVVVNLPFVGWIVNLALTLIGVGGLFAWVVAAHRGRRVEPAGI